MPWLFCFAFSTRASSSSRSDFSRTGAATSISSSNASIRIIWPQAFLMGARRTASSTRRSRRPLPSARQLTSMRMRLLDRRLYRRHCGPNLLLRPAGGTGVRGGQGRAWFGDVLHAYRAGGNQVDGLQRPQAYEAAGADVQQAPRQRNVAEVRKVPDCHRIDR
jgi:hypothetical protein